MEEKKTPNIERPKIEAVATGKVNKKSVGRRIVNSFIPEDTPDVKDYIIFDRLIPAIKDTFVDLAVNTLEMIFYGKTSGRRRRSSGGGGHVDYAGASKRREPERRESRRLDDFNDIIFDSYEEADRVLDILMDWIERYDQCSILDFYDASGVSASSHNYTNDNYGWTDLRDAHIVRARGGGYILDLPTPRQLRR